MKYNFDEDVTGNVQDTIKWGEADALFGGEDLLPLWIADMDFQAPKPVIDALIKRAEAGLFMYTAMPESTLEAVASWLSERHGWAIETDWIRFAPGVIALLEASVRAFTAPGDRVIVQPPVYGPFGSVVSALGREAVHNPLKQNPANGKYEMDLADLERKLRETGARLLILCSPHNPVGRVWTKEELAGLAELCVRFDVTVVSDEIHADLVLTGKHCPLVLADPRMAERTVVCLAPSKTFNIAGLQSAFAIVPDDRLRTVFDKALGKKEPNPLSAAAMEAAYREGQEWLAQCLDYLRGNARFAVEYLAEHLPQARCVVPEATYLLWVDLRPFGIPAKSLKTLLVQEAKVAVSDGSIFVGEGEGFIRINLASRRARVEEGLRRIAAALGSANGG
ncbi:MalY/PatB family protein [Cohnella nanjingensis]|uniref:cysteine-S-conjugate beta-lyase n=1 Tax=Cohnella nanjingensis TaxID=1387779 RepID=A0A7X0RWG0_9BACL|nr:MalY/PatB family protein [Cohnella nanjingensis]MBB6674943.1 pyridoxal phosphate-dependent aminotransferase [Cohnella nanjingensis]